METTQVLTGYNDPGQDEDEPITAAVPEPTIPREVVVAQVNAMYRRAYDDSIEIRRKGQDARRLYNFDFSEEFKGKQEHQSQHPLPTVFTMANFIANGIAEAATGGEEDWLVLTGETDLGRVIAPLFRELVQRNLDEEDFEGQLGPAVVSGLLLGAPVFRCFPAIDGAWPGYSRVESSDMTHILRDPTGRNLYTIYVDVVDLADIERRLAAGDSGYDPDEVERLRQSSGSRSHDEDEEMRREWADVMGLEANSDLRKPVLLMEYWGPFWDEAKQLAIPFGRCVVANKEALLAAPEEDPYGDQVVPLIHGDIIPRQGAAYGIPYAWPAVTLAKAKTRAFNFTLDSAINGSNNAIEMDETNATASAIALAKSGNLAGAVLRKRGPGALLTTTQLGQFNPALMAVTQMIDQEFQAATNATDLNRGIPAQSGTKEQTLGEFKGKVELSNRALKGVARAIELRLQEPLVEMMIHHLREFGSVTDPAIIAAAPKGYEEARELAMSYLAEKARAAVGVGAPPPAPPTELDVRLVLQKAWTEKLTVRVGGISAVLDARERAQALVGVVQFLTALTPPDKPPIYDLWKTGKEILRLNGFVPDDTLRDEDEWAQEVQMIQQQMMFEAQQRMMMSQPGPGGANGQDE